MPEFFQTPVVINISYSYVQFDGAGSCVGRPSLKKRKRPVRDIFHVINHYLIRFFFLFFVEGGGGGDDKIQIRLGDVIV